MKGDMNMKKLIVLLITLAFFNTTSVSMATHVYIDDGLSHTFDDSTYQNDNVYLDETVANNPGTHVDLVDGGKVEHFSARNNASITMTGGSVGDISSGGGIYALENATISMVDGSVGGYLLAWDNATVDMTGGSVGDHLIAYNNATITMSGGSVGFLEAWGDADITMSGGLIEHQLRAYDNGILYLYGSDFEVNGTPLVNDDKLSDFGTFDANYYTGTITGILADGSALNNSFYIYNTGDYEGTGDIIIAGPINIPIDIKPRRCPNRLNIKSKGKLSVAILGSDNFDVNEIDVLSIRLAGVIPLRSSYKDVATPLVDAEECDCSTEGSDGYTDLILKFDTQAIVATLGEVADGDEFLLELIGELFDGTQIKGEDCIIIHAKPKPKTK